MPHVVKDVKKDGQELIAFNGALSVEPTTMDVGRFAILNGDDEVMYLVWESFPYEGFHYAEFSTWQEVVEHIGRMVGKSKRNRKQYEDWEAGKIKILLFGNEILVTSQPLSGLPENLEKS